MKSSKHTLSMPSISRPLLTPRGGGGGTAELRSSLPRAGEVIKLDPNGRFLVEVDALPLLARC